MITRRSVLIGAASTLAAPAIIRVADLMPVRNRLVMPMASASGSGWEWVRIPTDKPYILSAHQDYEIGAMRIGDNDAWAWCRPIEDGKEG